MKSARVSSIDIVEGLADRSRFAFNRDVVPMPDGMLSILWIFNRLGEQIFRIDTAAGLLTTNIAWGSKDGRTLYITEAETGSILRADVPLSP